MCGALLPEAVSGDIFSDVNFPLLCRQHASTVLYAVPSWYDILWISLIYRCS